MIRKNTGLAKISGGVYRINENEGKTIASFVPPPLLHNIDWNILSDAQKWLFSEMACQWEIIAHWIVYFRTRAVDIKQMPFTHPEFLDQRAKAESYSIQLDLCAAIWEAIEIRHYYPTAYDWWLECIKEVQQSQIKAIEELGEGKIQLNKGEIEDGLRRIRQLLEQGELPFSRTSKNQHIYRLYTSAINLKDDKTVKKRWNEYLKSLRQRAKELKTNDGTKAIVHHKGYLYYQNRNTLTPIPVTSIDKDTILNVRAKFALPT